MKKNKKPNNKVLIENWKKINIQEDYQKLIAGKEKLHANSEELVNLLIATNVLPNVTSVFEIGCGCGRNLKYIHEKGEGRIKLFGNDLIKEKCYQYMDNSLKNVLNFIEIDTESLFTNNTYNIDLLLSSDHMMHLSPATFDKISLAIEEKWKPKYIVIRETSKKPRDGDHPKYIHNYDRFGKFYKTISKTISKNDDKYTIYIFEKI